MTSKKWVLLCALRPGTPIDVLGQDLLVLEDDVYKLSSSQYCLAEAPYGEPDATPRLISFYWACSEKAFRRAYFKEVEGDDMAVCNPPSELLPEGPGATYGQIRDALRSCGGDRAMEHASYRIMSDGAFVHRSLENASATYHFRSPEPVDDELPYAILWKFFNNQGG